MRDKPTTSGVRTCAFSRRWGSPTAREFVAAAGQKCPACGSENVAFGEINVEGSSTYQEATCDDCGVGFNTVSRLVGYMVDQGAGPETISEDFDEITDAQSVDAPKHELLQAHYIIRKLAKLVRYYGYKEEMPKLRTKERAAILGKAG